MKQIISQIFVSDGLTVRYRLNSSIIETLNLWALYFEVVYRETSHTRLVEIIYVLVPSFEND